MSDINRVDLWYKIPKNQTFLSAAMELENELDKAGVVILDQHPKGVKRKNLKMGYVQDGHYINITGFAVERGDSIGTSSKSLPRRVLRDLSDGKFVTFRPEGLIPQQKLPKFKKQKKEPRRYIPQYKISKSGKRYTREYLDTKEGKIISVRQFRKREK